MHTTVRNQSQTGCALPQDLRYYILRGDNMMVPMVPADQLPFRLPGVPRQLSHQQMSSESWKYLSEPGKIPAEHHMRSPSVRTKSQFRAPDHQVRNDQNTAGERIARPSRWSPPPIASIDDPLVQRMTTAPMPEKVLSMTDKFAEIFPLDAQRFGYHVPYPSGIEPDSSKKEYCTHWIKTGECAFTAIGCKFKHEMPEIAKLRELGFREIPRWWKDKTAIAARGPTWIEQRRAAQKNDGDINLSEMPARREFDPSTFKKRSNIERDAPSEDIRQKRSLLRREANYERPVQSNQLSVVEHVMYPVNSMPGLLIDLDDVPAPTPSPQFSSVSSASTASESTKGSHHTSPSPPPSVTMKAARISGPVSKTVNNQSSVRLEAKHSPLVSSHRSGSEVSWTSVSSEEDESSELTREQKKAAYQAFKAAAAPTKSYGLQQSKYATVPHPAAKNEHPNKHLFQQAPGQQNKMSCAAKAYIKAGKTKEMALKGRVRGSVTKISLAPSRTAAVL